MSELGFTPTAIDNGGLDIELSDHELYYLRAAGIDPHMLNNNDRAAVIRALMFDSKLIEDHKAGGFAALIYKSGALRDMLERTAEEEEEEELEGLDEETKKKLRGLPNKHYWLMNLHLLNQSNQRELIEEQIQEKKEAESKKEEERIRQEVQIFQQNGAARYAEMNPIPAPVIGMLLAGQIAGINGSVRLDDDGIAVPKAEMLHPDQTPMRMMMSERQLQNGSVKQNASGPGSMAENFTAISAVKPVVFDNTSAMAAPKSIDFGSIPVTQMDIIQALTEVPKSIKLVPEGLKDEDPTHLKAPMPERKVQHEAISHGMSLHKDNKHS
jgi:hypothetical protein